VSQRTSLLIVSIITLAVGLGSGILFQVFAISLLPVEFRLAAWGLAAGFWFMFAALGMLLVLSAVEPQIPRKSEDSSQ
jgi:ABC-type thiamin/hydroxymethylpyrimidine transport system permease subunit